MRITWPILPLACVTDGRERPGIQTSVPAGADDASTRLQTGCHQHPVAGLSLHAHSLGSPGLLHSCHLGDRKEDMGQGHVEGHGSQRRCLLVNIFLVLFMIVCVFAFVELNSGHWHKKAGGTFIILCGAEHSSFKTGLKIKQM